ncbi:MAG: hypothetical protein JJE46_11290, partial [Acidimicrobiia bacterium]|nr:hypothetical protein [Acidimicrobiia bacterium]
GPAQAEVQKVAERVNRPGDRCVESRGVRACTARGYEKWRAAWIGAAQRVRATVPVTSPTYVAVQQVGDRGRNALDAEVRERIVGMGTGYGYFGKTRSDDRGFENIAWSVLPANAAVGLPRAVETAGRPCYAGGQARAVLALWALIRATGSEFDTWYLPVATDSDGIGDTWDAANAPWAIAFWPPTWDTDATVPVVYARTDVRLALALAHRTTTQAELRTSWARWTHPAATSTELADAFSVPDPTDARTSRVPGELETCS